MGGNFCRTGDFEKRNFGAAANFSGKTGKRIYQNDSAPRLQFRFAGARRGYSFVSPVRVVPETNGNFVVRETESEITVEEFEVADEAADTLRESEKVIEIPAVSTKALRSADTKKINLPRTAFFTAAGIAVVVLAFFGLKPYFSKIVQPQFSVENVRINRITNSGKVFDSAVSPDGNYVLCPAGDKDGVSLWLRQLSTNSASRLTAPVKGGFWGFAFAPDNSYVYYILNNQAEPQKSGLYKIPLLGGEPRKIKENVSSIAVSPDGKKIALVRLSDKTNIFIVNTDGEDEQTVAALSKEFSLWGLSWTPNGTGLLCTFRKTVEDKRLYYISEMSPENGRETIVLPPQEKIIFGASWLPDKSALLLTMREPNADIRQIWQYFPDSTDWRRVTNDDNSYKFAHLTRDGKTIVTNQASRLAAIWVANDLPLDKKTPEKTSLISNSSNFRQITDGVNDFDRLGWLADNRLIYSITENSKEMVFSINADGANARQITSGEDGIWIYPSAAGSRRSIAFLSNRSGLKQVWRVDEDGKNLTKMTETETPVFIHRILRDDATVLYLTQQPKGTFLFKQTADGQTAQLTESDTGTYAVSADEKLLAVEIFDKNTGKHRVEVRSLADGQTIKIFDFSVRREIKFTPDSKNLAYDAHQGDFSQIMIQPLEGGEPHALTDFKTDDIFSFDWSPDGRQLAVIRGKQLNDAVLIKSVAR